MLGTTKDPVCKAKVKKSTPYKLNLDSRVFYFDSAACKATFEKDPHRFLRGKKKKSFLNSLAEASDGRPKTCH